MSRDNSSSPSTALLAVSLALCMGSTAAATYLWTRDREQEKYLAEKKAVYDRELLIKEKTVQARTLAGEAPASGTLVEDVSIQRVYLWQVEDLKHRFQPSGVENVMKNVGDQHVQYFFPSLKVVANKTPLNTHDDLDHDDVNHTAKYATPYNKLITNHECILANLVRKPNQETFTHAFIRAGPRRQLHFDPATVSAAIVTCGGLCPGLNNVIREITRTLHQLYGIDGKVYGIQGGYRGFSDVDAYPPIILTPELVQNIHHEGGTVLGSSRGGFDIDLIVNFLKDHKINQLYVIGGDGTHRGAFKIHEACMEKGMNVAVAGIPKTIDNDVDYIDHSFGFASAVEAAQTAIRSAKIEAVCNKPNGIGIVKLMGRSAGFIAAHATMSSSDVDLCLVPEVPLVLDGPNGCLAHLRRRVREQGYAVVVVAEGAGEDVLGVSAEVDAGGNRKLPAIGEFMKTSIQEYYQKHGDEATVKYIDPSYTVRSVPANAADSLYCMQLAQNAVHGAMAGYTGFSVGLVNNKMVFIPIPELVATSPRKMNARGRTWERVLALTRQPNTVPPLKEGETLPVSESSLR